MRSRWRAALGVVLSAALIYLTLRGISATEVARRLSMADPLLFIASIFCATAIFGLRARRWQTILEPAADRVPLGPLWRATAIGMMVNNLVPARAGEVARAYALTREASVAFPAALASLVIDRLFDAIVLLLLAAVALLDPALSTGQTLAGRPVSSFALSAVGLVLALVVALYLLVFFPAALLRLFAVIAGRISPRMAERGERLLRTFITGLSVLRSPGRFTAVLGWTLAHWLLNALSFWLAFRAVGITAPFSAAFFLQAFIALGTAVPALPGFFGVFEYMSVQGLGVYGVEQQLAATWAIGFHILSFIPITLIGVYYFARLGMKMSELRAPAEATA
ncbi:MAG TPA: lysylphosphatidylglycerol synthase transmembrane domain-containing protein [Gemmatimonadaceae bacterium]|nr:lysylphosphatidylglycerol synthase transmembrane domain-containing protein [Gemmatimonadaceae bacterium]